MNNLDQVTLDRIKLLHPALREEALEMYKEQSSRLTSPQVRLRYAYTLRTYAEQDGLFAIGRTKPGKKVTNAKGGQSFHNFGLAYDIVFLIDKDSNGTFETASWDDMADYDKDGTADWKEVVIVAKMYGYSWGGEWRSFKDKPHFEKTFGKTVIELDKLAKAGRVIEGIYPVL